MVTKKAEYAIHILACLAQQNNKHFIPSQEIAHQANIPLNLIGQLSSKMKKRGWIKSARGPSGGLKLASPPEKIQLREVIELFDGPFGITRCLVIEGYCPEQTTCPLRNIWAKAQQKTIEVLEQTSIRDLAEAKKSLKLKT